VFAFAAAGLAALVVDPLRRSDGVLLAGLAVPLVLLYMAYYFGAGPGGGAGNHPVSISTFPFLAVAAAWLLGILIVTSDRRPCGRRDRRRTAGVIGFAVSVQTLGQTKASLASAARARELAGRRFRRAAS